MNNKRILIAAVFHFVHPVQREGGGMEGNHESARLGEEYVIACLRKFGSIHSRNLGSKLVRKDKVKFRK